MFWFQSLKFLFLSQLSVLAFDYWNIILGKKGMYDVSFSAIRVFGILASLCSN
jgi:hypothetical protein